MKQSAVLQVLARLAASLIALCIFAVAPALAGDRANVNFLGYSEDGRYFAYEEYGEHDGSGGVYSSIYIIDISTDKWVGTPFSVDEGGDDADTPPLSDARAKVLAKAADKLKQLKIGTPVEIYYLLGEGMGDDKGHFVTFSTPNCCQPGSTQDDVFTLNVSLGYAKPEDGSCDQMTEVFGFKLVFTDAQGEHVLHDDGTTIPKSRGCPVDYRLYAVIAPFEQGMPRLAILSVYPAGFEGPDRRFMVVPIDTP